MKSRGSISRMSSGEISPVRMPSDCWSATEVSIGFRMRSSTPRR